MGIQQLVLTRNLMEQAGEDHFDMASWFNHHSLNADLETIGVQHFQVVKDCGTSACFGGFAKMAAAKAGELIGPDWADGQDWEGAVAEWLGVPERVFYSSWKDGPPVLEDPDDPDDLPQSIRDWYDSADYRFIVQAWQREGGDRNIGQETRRAEYRTIMAYISWKIVALSEIQSEVMA